VIDLHFRPSNASLDAHQPNLTLSFPLAVEKELKEAFRLYDKEGNGFIPTSCLKEILKELDDQLSDADLDGMIAEIDSDGSGTVDFDGERHKLLFSPKSGAQVENAIKEVEDD
jgi:EF-hand domain pair